MSLSLSLYLHVLRLFLLHCLSYVSVLVPVSVSVSDDDRHGGQRASSKKDKKESGGSRRKKGDELELVDINAPLGAGDYPHYHPPSL